MDYGDKSLTILRQVKIAIDKAIKEDGTLLCVTVSSIIKKAKKDPRTVLLYLKLLEIGEYGKLSKDEKLFQILGERNG